MGDTHKLSHTNRSKPLRDECCCSKALWLKREALEWEMPIHIKECGQGGSGRKAHARMEGDKRGGGKGDVMAREIRQRGRYDGKGVVSITNEGEEARSSEEIEKLTRKRILCPMVDFSSGFIWGTHNRENEWWCQQKTACPMAIQNQLDCHEAWSFAGSPEEVNQGLCMVLYLFVVCKCIMMSIMEWAFYECVCVSEAAPHMGMIGLLVGMNLV
ncbi:hypothetical protein HYDPIDRAFT_168208 [Hydnomerulius pinastri MD-312]|uniref:Uncharacterized protein n=1 Tax=Hydnomerulius pinastri MD-312 TaxID=994086 RepID=A0A0C9VE00_9AGAM|nr:hypothetical protein HYDPIDRAFT_168208 [Hydnomerulius pinastri MD-312]